MSKLLQKFRKRLSGPDNRLIFQEHDGYTEYFDDPQHYEIFKAALTDLRMELRMEVVLATSSYKTFIKWLTIFKESGLYNYTSSLTLDIQDINYDPVLIREPELNILSELIATSTSLTSVILYNVKLTELGTTIFYTAINSNSNIVSLSFNKDFNTWNFANHIFDIIGQNQNLRILELADIDEKLTDTIGQLFNNLRQNNSLIERLSLGFTLTNGNFEPFIQFLEAANKLNIFYFENTMNLTAINDELCDRYWSVIQRRNLTDHVDINNFTARQIQQLDLNYVRSLNIGYGTGEQEIIVEATLLFIEKLKLKDDLLAEVNIFNIDNELIYQLLALDKIISLIIPLKANDDNIEVFYKILPQLENLNTLIIIYIAGKFADDILNYVKYNSSLTQSNIRTVSGQNADHITDRNKHNQKLNSLTLIDILKQYSKK